MQRFLSLAGSAISPGRSFTGIPASARRPPDVFSPESNYALARWQGGRKPRRVISPWDIVASVLPVYLLILAGAAFRLTGLLGREHDEGIMRVVYTVMMPCYILDKILGSEVLRSGTVVISSIVVGFVLITGGFAIAALVGRLIGLERGSGMRTFALTAGSQNFGFTAVPVAEILWSTSAIAVLFIHNLGVNLAIWSVGVMILRGEMGLSWRKLVNGPLIAVVAGLLLVALGLDKSVTGPVREAISMLGVGAFPIGIFIIGCTIVDMIGAERPSLKVITAALLVRILLVPAFFLTAAKYLPIADELRQVIVIQAAMPAGMTAIILARLYGGRPAIAVQIVVFSTALSLLSLPWIIAIGCRWIGLKPFLP